MTKRIILMLCAALMCGVFVAACGGDDSGGGGGGGGGGSSCQTARPVVRLAGWAPRNSALAAIWGFLPLFIMAALRRRARRSGRGGAP